MIRELAKIQSCIIIGKCANHLLRDYDNTVSVYIEAPRAFCVKRIVERLGVTEDEAHKMIYQTDKYRADYYKYYTGGENWTNPVLYDMTLNTERMGIERAAQLITEYLKIKLGDDIITKKGSSENVKALKQIGLFKDGK
jgi:cytidylate kinase